MNLRLPTTLFALLAATLAAVAAGPAAAQEATPDDWMHTTPAAAAADALAAQGQARSALSGQTVRPMKIVAPPATAGVPTAAAPPASAVGGLTRAQVRAELQAARASGEWARLNAEAVDPAAAPARAPGQPGAAPVYAERR